MLSELITNPPSGYSLIYRPESDPDNVELLIGEVRTATLIEDAFAHEGEHLLVVPYRQITERGFACHDDSEPIVSIDITARHRLPIAEVLAILPAWEVSHIDGVFDPPDAEYAESVRRIIASEIGLGEGSNFVIKRSFNAKIPDWSAASPLAIFRNLLARESGTYWTFLISFGGRTLVGASPESHVTVDGGTVTMNPISGTYRYPGGRADLDGMLRFLADQKESDELYMVLDEELKMMARICSSGGTVIGPRLKEMARLAHTEYHISGSSTMPLSTIVRETLFAPTVTGSPVENACRVIKRHEPDARGYYSGFAALVEPGRKLDSAILIRTADIDSAGNLALGVGATLVRHSDPDSEVAETHAKVAGLLSALSTNIAVPGSKIAPAFGNAPAVVAALEQRNRHLARFWLHGRNPQLNTRWHTLVIDAEDTFTDMFAHQLRHLGHRVETRGYRDVEDVDGWDIVVMGPGPGDPRDSTDPKIAKLLRVAAQLYETRQPFLAVCLGHQVLSHYLGLPLARLATPNQGRQRTISLFGEKATVGFYNTFVAQSDHDFHGSVAVSRDPATKEVYAMREEFFRSFQFHPESILSADGVDILANQLSDLLAVRR